MLKLILILLIGLVFESTGVVLLKKGMTQIGNMPKVSANEVIRVVKAGVTNAHILSGVFFEALFFVCLLVLLSKSEVSFLWPLTALSFVFATIAAMVFLGERVSGIRWLGVVLIMLGAAFISYSEHVKPKPPGTPPSTDAKSVEP